jgi:hypothetical protein
MNCLLGRPETGFTVGPTVEACTKGICMWSEFVAISTRKTLFFFKKKNVAFCIELNELPTE